MSPVNNINFNGSFKKTRELEKLYPQTDFKESQDELIQKINEKLV